MNFSPLPVIMAMAGVVLLYAAIKDVNPADVVKNSLKGKPTVSTPKDPLKMPSGFDPGAGAGKGGGGGGTGSW
jgi:hypothetical protein